ncbi:MAG: hypothetical protein CBB99_06285 [Bacteroidetes bacterium TMED39]|nr:MAG: hypothetical protein CBB99_06285 [Bacteroidetes bacterium TMED39]
MGGGSWGSALVKLLSANGPVEWHIYEDNFEEKKKYFAPECSNISSPPFLQFQSKPDFLLIAIPVAFLHNYVKSISFFARSNNIPIISVCKGILARYQKPMVQCLVEYFGVPIDQTALLLGPSHAEEVVLKKSTKIALATSNKALFVPFKSLLKRDFFVIDWRTNMHSLEWCGALKNVYAIGAGLLDGLDTGDNLKALYVAMCFSEMSYYTKDTEAQNWHYTLGDLLVTCNSKHSRNYQLGKALAQGEKIEHFLFQNKIVPEGYFVLKNLGANPKNPLFTILREIVLFNRNTKDLATHLLLTS